MRKKSIKKKTEVDKFLEKPAVRILFTLASTIVATIVLAFSSLTILEIYSKNYSEAPKYLVWIFVFMGVMSLIAFLKDRTKINFIKALVLLIINVALGVTTLFAVDVPYLFSLTGGLFCVTIIVSRIFEIIKKHTLRSIIFNAAIIIFAVSLASGIFSSTGNGEADILSVITVECIFIAIVSFVEASRIALSSLKFKVLAKIVLSTFSLEIIFGLLTMIICFSIVLSAIEPAEAGFGSFGDALWYSFAVVTTIGFGDVVATTLVGRIITVILGLYGLVVVAVITSIIVNFYNETAGKHDSIELKQISKDEKKDKE